MNIYPKDYFATSPIAVTGTCFVMMPFASKFDEVFSVIKEAVESDEVHLECKRGDDFLKPHILETILMSIARSEYIIADLTDQNPNVFYELGIAHCIKNMKNLVLITQDMKFVPFDLRQYRCIVYEQSISGASKLKRDIANTLRENIGNQFTFTLEEGQRYSLPKKLSGKRYLYEIEIWLPFIADDAVKSQIYFTKCKADGTKERLSPDLDLYIQVGEKEELEHVPWHIQLLKVNNKKALLILRKSAS